MLLEALSAGTKTNLECNFLIPFLMRRRLWLDLRGSREGLFL